MLLSKILASSAIGQLLSVGFGGLEDDSYAYVPADALAAGRSNLFARNLRLPRQTLQLLRVCQEWSRLPLLHVLSISNAASWSLRIPRSNSVGAGSLCHPATDFSARTARCGRKLRALGFRTLTSLRDLPGV